MESIRHKDVPLRSNFKEENDAHMEGLWLAESHQLLAPLESALAVEIYLSWNHTLSGCAYTCVWGRSG